LIAILGAKKESEGFYSKSGLSLFPFKQYRTQAYNVKRGQRILQLIAVVAARNLDIMITHCENAVSQNLIQNMFGNLHEVSDVIELC
jgi:hypothetical protein